MGFMLSHERESSFYMFIGALNNSHYNQNKIIHKDAAEIWQNNTVSHDFVFSSLCLGNATEPTHYKVYLMRKILKV